MGRPDGDINQHCAEVVGRLLARHGWQLLEQAEFIRRTQVVLEAHQGVEVLYAAYGVYNQTLYTACSGAEGVERRERAYGELFRVIYDRAWKSYPDVAEDATQIAISEVLTRFTSCNEPRAFIPFALRYLMGAARSLRRQNGRATSLEREVGEEGLTLGDIIADTTNLEEEAVTREERLSLHRFLTRYMHQHPRAQKQIDAVRMKFLFGLDDEVISQALGVSVPNVHVLRSRGLARLRQDPGWRQSWEQEGL